eukprot:GHVU01017398.1.p1 GENE.GHVU01017398.1~~GHVU01017398.1.p1  ORF type:complete len:103 (+),score=8.18 GHVU01017398.1:134-442(+)
MVAPTGKEIISVVINTCISVNEHFQQGRSNHILSIIEAKVGAKDSEVDRLRYWLQTEDRWVALREEPSDIISPFEVIGFSSFVSAGDAAAAVLASVHVYLRH